MKANLEQKLNLYLENVNRIKKTYRMQPGMIRHLSALMYTSEGKELDTEAIRRCHDLIKAETNVFSPFRGDMAVGVATLLSLQEAPRQLLQQALDVYLMMKKDAAFKASDYLAMAAYQIAANAEPDTYAAVIGRAGDFYDGMKKHHWMLTGKEDYIYNSMLALSDIPVQTGVERMEAIFEEFMNDVVLRGKIHALSQVLVLGKESAASVEKVRALREACHQKKWRLDQEYTYPLLGVLSMMPGTAEAIAEELAETCSFLRGQKGFKGFGALALSRQELTMVAASIVAYANADEMKTSATSTALSTSITSIIIAAQEAAIIAAVVVVTANSSTSSSSS